MTSLTERAEAATNEAPATAAAEPTYTPAPLEDPGIPEPGADGPEQVPVHVAWSRVMGTVRNVSKAGWYGKPGQNGSYQFRGVDAALNAFGPACRLHGVLVLPVKTEAAYRDVKTSTGKNSRECTVTVTYRLIGPVGDFIEVQAGGEEATFQRGQLDRLLKLGKLGIDAISDKQRRTLGANWPLD